MSPLDVGIAVAIGLISGDPGRPLRGRRRDRDDSRDPGAPRGGADRGARHAVAGDLPDRARRRARLPSPRGDRRPGGSMAGRTGRRLRRAGRLAHHRDRYEVAVDRDRSPARLAGDLDPAHGRGATSGPAGHGADPRRDRRPGRPRLRSPRHRRGSGDGSLARGLARDATEAGPGNVAPRDRRPRGPRRGGPRRARAYRLRRSVSRS